MTPLPWAKSLMWMGGLILLFSTTFHFCLWRTRLGRALGCSVPDLRGTWRGLLTPTQVPNGVVNPGPIIVFITIKQTAFRVETKLFTMDGQSRVLSSGFTNIQGIPQLVCSYWTNPQFNYQGRNSPYLGTVVLSPEGYWPAVLQGFHYTERMSRGEIKFSTQTREIARSYKHALTLNYESRPKKIDRTKSRPKGLAPASPLRTRI